MFSQPAEFCVLQYLVRVVQQWTVVTMITDSIHVSVFLVSVIHIGAVVAFIQNVWKINRKTLSTLDTIVGLFFFVGPFFFTISVDVYCTGVPFSVVVSVYLSRVVFIGAVVASVANFILVKVKLAGIVKEGAVVLEWKRVLAQGLMNELD